MKPYYEKDGITIYHGDCREVSLCVDANLILTDPPYEKEAHTNGRRVSGAMKMDALDFDPMNEALRIQASEEMYKIACGWVLVFCQIEAISKWINALSVDNGLRYMRTQVWVKPDATPQFTGDRPGMGHESIVTCWHNNTKSKWNGGGRLGVHTHNVGRHETEHQTEKPLTLIKSLVGLFSNHGDLVVDPFMGSGTTLRAAKDLGRKAIGIEIEEKYCEIAAKRLAQEVLY